MQKKLMQLEKQAVTLFEIHQFHRIQQNHTGSQHSVSAVIDHPENTSYLYIPQLPVFLP